MRARGSAAAAGTATLFVVLFAGRALPVLAATPASGAQIASAPRVITVQPPPSSPLPALTCTARNDDNVSYQLCSGRIPSFDDVPLDVDVTIPAQGSSPMPLLVMLHGYGNDKKDWESTVKCGADADRCNYNNLYFASKGYLVLNYTARGFHGSCGPAVSSADGRCAKGWTHLADRRFEIHDTQFLAGVLVDAGLARPAIGVTGDSYGGGQSWLLAMQADRVTGVDGSLLPWKSPQGQAMSIAVAVPKYPWTDLAHSLLPNGRSTDDVLVDNASAAQRNKPIGIMKQSFVSYLFESGQQNGHYAPPGADPTADLVTWYGLISAGEPYQTPAAQAVVEQVTDYKSAYYQDALIAHDLETGHLTPVLDIQGWTDNLFPQDEGASMVNKLRSRSGTWPAFLYTTDVGHPPADDNQSSIWRPANAAAVSFIDHYLLAGSAAIPSDTYQEQVSTCDPSQPGEIRHGSDLRQLAPAVQAFSSVDPRETTSLAGDQPVGLATDPIGAYVRNGGHGGCIKLPAAPAEVPLLNAAWEFAVCAPFTMRGEPALSLKAVIQGVDAELNSRLWDVAPDGSRTLVTRGAYRWRGDPGQADIKYAMFGNGWSFAAGHRIRIEVTQNDAPFLRADNLPSSISYGQIGLQLPVVSQIVCPGTTAAGAAAGADQPPSAAGPAPEPASGQVLADQATAGLNQTAASGADSPSGTVSATGGVLADTGIRFGSAAAGLALLLAGAMLLHRRRGRRLVP